MIIECSSCSRSSTERSNPQSEAWKGKSASRNESELDSASLHYMEVTILPNRLKSVTVGEVTFTRSRRASRGDWRQRAEKEKSRNLRGPFFNVRESDTFIVAEKGVMNLERREVTVDA